MTVFELIKQLIKHHAAHELVVAAWWADEDIQELAHRAFGRRINEDELYDVLKACDDWLVKDGIDMISERFMDIIANTIHDEG